MPPVEEKEVEFFHPSQSDPRRYANEGSSTDVYLDDVQRHEAEKQRARVEGREPDYDNPGSTVGTPLLRREQLNADHRLAHDDQPVAQTLTVFDGEPEQEPASGHKTVTVFDNETSTSNRSEDAAGNFPTSGDDSAEKKRRAGTVNDPGDPNDPLAGLPGDNK